MASRKPKTPKPLAVVEHCGNCRFFLAAEGICRFGPGKIVIDGEDVFTIQPPKSPDEWCGQHQFPRQ